MVDLHYVPHGMANRPAVYLIAIDFASSITFAPKPPIRGNFKGSLGSDSEAGSRFAERLLTVGASCRQQ
jgi:hypothetical protein